MNDIRDEIANAMDYRRYARACAISDSFITFHFIDANPEFLLLASIRGSGQQTYTLFIDEVANSFYHDCPDFCKGDKICKHIAKIALSLPEIYARRILSCYYSSRVLSKNEFFAIQDEINQKVADKRFFFIEIGWKKNAHYDNILRANKSSSYGAYCLQLYGEILLQNPENFSQFLVEIQDPPIFRKVLNAIIEEIPAHIRSWVFERLKFKEMPPSIGLLLDEIDSLYSTKISIRNSHQMPILL